jgi:dihydropteroate synthase
MLLSPFSQQTTLNCGGRALSLKEPLVMGVINVTTDSFYTGSRAMDKKSILEKAGLMISEGADILDLGAMSSRPGATRLPAEVEKDRLSMACEILRTAFPDIPLSIDTDRLSILESLLPIGIHMINDISAGKENEEIWSFAARHHLPYVLMHMKGDPSSMNHLSQYDDLIAEILDFYVQRIPKIIKAGVKDLILDPGIGFAKNIEQNFHLLRHLHVFRMLEFPILIGLSRKSLIWRTLDITPEESLNGTTALHMQALNEGASILRVHDVKAAKQTILLWKKLQQPIIQ